MPIEPGTFPCDRCGRDRVPGTPYVVLVTPPDGMEQYHVECAIIRLTLAKGTSHAASTRTDDIRGNGKALGT